MAPPPPEYGQVTVERAMWQSFGKRVDDMTIEEYEIKLSVLQAETADDERRRQKK